MDDYDITKCERTISGNHYYGEFKEKKFPGTIVVTYRECFFCGVINDVTGDTN